MNNANTTTEDVLRGVDLSRKLAVVTGASGGLGRLRAIMESATAHNPAVWQGLTELGISGLIVPAEHGGSELERRAIFGRSFLGDANYHRAADLADQWFLPQMYS